jgi:alpha-D-ribose 1-methylphosphonate 5-triphosphate synthase subunit PhnG
MAVSLESEARKGALAVLARAETGALRDAWQGLAGHPPMQVLRQPEVGLVMIRGRIGGGGAPFNLGEATVARAAVRLESGEVGYGHVLGRETEKALLVARFDALWQSETHRPAVDEMLTRVRRHLADSDDLARRKTAATRVNFFTLVRGEDQ